MKIILVYLTLHTFLCNCIKYSSPTSQNVYLSLSFSSMRSFSSRQMNLKTVITIDFPVVEELRMSLINIIVSDFVTRILLFAEFTNYL